MEIRTIIIRDRDAGWQFTSVQAATDHAVRLRTSAPNDGAPKTLIFEVELRDGRHFTGRISVSRYDDHEPKLGQAIEQAYRDAIEAWQSATTAVAS